MPNYLFKAQVTLSRCQQNLQHLMMMARLFGSAAEGGLDDITLESFTQLVNHTQHEFQALDRLLGQSLLAKPHL